MADTLERLKILLNSSTPIVVVETAEEMRIVNMVRLACGSLNLAAFEWSIASGLVRCGSDGAPVVETLTGFTQHPTQAMRPAMIRPMSPPRQFITAANRLRP